MLYDRDARALDPADQRLNSSNLFWVTGQTDPPKWPRTNAGERREGGYFPTGTALGWAMDGEFLPAAGSRTTSGAAAYLGTNGFYWSSTPTSVMDAYYLTFSGSNVQPSARDAHAGGLGIRCVRR